MNEPFDGGGCLACGVASVALVYFGDQAFVECAACGCVANATSTCRPVRAKRSRLTSAGVLDAEKLIDEVADAAEGAVDEAMHDLRRDIEFAIEDAVASMMEEFGFIRKKKDAA